MSIANTPSPRDSDRLSAQLSRFEALFETVPLAIAMFDEDLRLIRANDRYHDLTSLAPTQSFARVIYDAFPNALADLTEQIDAVVGGSVGSATIRLPFRHETGPRVVEATVQMVDPGFGIGGVLFIGADVTEREDLREDLARSVSQLATIFDVIPE